MEILPLDELDTTVELALDTCRAECKRLGASAFLTKPIELNALPDAIRHSIPPLRS